MNATNTVAPEVQEFLDAVRTQLADLDPDEQRDITEGLEADLTDLVAERGRGALGDPVSYARELRAAAGLVPEMARRRTAAVPVAARVHGLLDAGRRQWRRATVALPGDSADLLTVLQPVWWVLRGWVAVEMAAMWLGDWSLTIVPGGELPGVVAVLVGVALSIQLGRGRLWPADGWHRLVVLRVLLLGLNCFAVAMIPVVLNGLDHGKNAMLDAAYARAHVEQEQLDEARFGSRSTAKAGLYLDGTWVSNIYPYDAKGRPLVGVQLFNQVGEPINVITQPEYEQPELDDNGNPIDAQGNPIDPGVQRQPRVYYPWTNGATQLLNVFPIPSRVQDGESPSPTAFAEDNPPTVGAFPLPSVPRVSLPGIKPGVLPASR
jgi:hypothetical protein